MEIQSVAIDKLIPAPYNPRKDLGPDDPEYVALARSLGRWGVVEPIVWNKQTGHVVGGHQRLKILKDAQADETDVVVVDLPLEDEKALNVALNKIQGDWAFPALPELLSDLDAEGFDVTLTGFDDKEIERLLVGTEAQIEDPAVEGFADGAQFRETPALVAVLAIPENREGDLKQAIHAFCDEHGVEYKIKKP